MRFNYEETHHIAFHEALRLLLLLPFKDHDVGKQVLCANLRSMVGSSADKLQISHLGYFKILIQATFIHSGTRDGYKSLDIFAVIVAENTS